MSEEDKNKEKTMPKEKEKEKKEDTNIAEEGLDRGDMAAQEQQRIFRQAKE